MYGIGKFEEEKKILRVQTTITAKAVFIFYGVVIVDQIANR